MKDHSIFESVRDHLDVSKFKIPSIQEGKKYFPDFLKELLDDYESYYTTHLKKHLDDNSVIDRISKLNISLIETVYLYYDGKVSEATIILFKTLDDLTKAFTVWSELEKGTKFYRARKGEQKQFTKKELFHIDFELRHIVSSNRYSIPGFPALYLGDTTYVCWEEFDRTELKSLWFSKVENKSKLGVFNLYRMEDLLSHSEDMDFFKLDCLRYYLMLFPLTLACTIKVKNPKGNFKPEYIIPQLLSEYISKTDRFDGVMFPSSKIDCMSVNLPKL